MICQPLSVDWDRVLSAVNIQRVPKHLPSSSHCSLARNNQTGVWDILMCYLKSLKTGTFPDQVLFSRMLCFPAGEADYVVTQRGHQAVGIHILPCVCTSTCVPTRHALPPLFHRQCGNRNCFLAVIFCIV